LRLFVAVEPPDAVRRELASRIAELADELPPARWVRPAGIHLTLAFLGEVEEASAAPLGAALEAELGPLPPFAAAVTGGGAFPPQGAVRVVWAGVEPEAPLARLAAGARRAVAAARLACDPKPFRAHLTLARCPRPWPGTARGPLVERLATWPRLDFEIASASLIESTLAPGGARYARRATALLRGGA
jgi:2'-5' RNA ligase